MVDAMSDPKRLRVRLVPLQLLVAVSDPCECGATLTSTEPGLTRGLANGLDAEAACPKCRKPVILTTQEPAGLVQVN